MIDRLNAKVTQMGFGNVRTTTDELEEADRSDDSLFSAPFDFVVCSSVCAFLDDYAGTVNTLVQLLKPGGIFVQWDWELDPTAQDPQGLTRTQMRQALGQAGLETIHVDSAFEIAMGDEKKRPLIGAGQTPG